MTRKQKTTHRGGTRPGAGRKRTNTTRVPHRARARFRQGHPLKVSLRTGGDIPTLQRRRIWRVLRLAFLKGCDKGRFRICQYSIRGNHIHLICEASDIEALSRGMQGFAVRVAKGINRHLGGRRGRVFAERYRLTVLSNPRRVRDGLRDVLQLPTPGRYLLAAERTARWHSSARYRGLRAGRACDGGRVSYGVGHGGGASELDPPVARARTRLLRAALEALGLHDRVGM